MNGMIRSEPADVNQQSVIRKAWPCEANSRSGGHCVSYSSCATGVRMYNTTYRSGSDTGQSGLSCSCWTPVTRHSRYCPPAERYFAPHVLPFSQSFRTDLISFLGEFVSYSMPTVVSA